MANVVSENKKNAIDFQKIDQITRGITLVFMMELGIRIPTDDGKGNIKFGQTISLLNDLLHEEIEKIVNQTTEETRLDRIVPYHCINPYGILTIDPVTNKYILTRDEENAAKKWERKQYHYPLETKLGDILNVNMAFILHDGINREFLKSIHPLITAINPELHYYPTNYSIAAIAPITDRGRMNEKQFKTAMNWMQLDNIVVPRVSDFLPYFLEESKFHPTQVITVKSIPEIECERYGIGWEKSIIQTNQQTYDLFVKCVKDFNTIDKIYLEHTFHMYPDDTTKTVHGLLFGVTRKIKEQPNALYFDEPI